MKSLLFYFFLFFPILIICDLPVHCLKHQIVGNWNFHISSILKEKDSREQCGHESPDNPKTSNKPNFELIEEKIIVLTLKPDDSVHLASTPSINSKNKWTMIYDEGFDVFFDDIHYFAFSDFLNKNNHDYSRCGMTLVGWWYNEKTLEKGCFKGEKEGDNLILTENSNQSFVVQPKFLEKIKLKDKHLFKKEGKLKNIFKTKKIKDFLFNEKEKNREFIEVGKEFPLMNLVTSLNQNVNKSWTAELHPDFESLSLKDLNKFAGRKKYVSFNSTEYDQYKTHGYSFLQKKSKRNQENDDKTVKEAKSSSFAAENEKNETNSNPFIERIENQESSNVELPENFDWASYLQPPRSQGNCGSCYIFATLAMLQTRSKIKYGEEITFSVQNLINCNYYNQGCDGGYPFLVGKFGHEFNLIEEKYEIYIGRNGKCLHSEKNEQNKSGKKWKVGDYYFIGGSYGRSNERAMMEEIYKNGPIVVSFEPQPDFMVYKKGIYHSLEETDLIKLGVKPEWEKVDHSVLCYGWGEENGEKYWLLQNTWGKTWGENGNFRIKRGIDESHIESISEAADPYIIYENKEIN